MAEWEVGQIEIRPAGAPPIASAANDWRPCGRRIVQIAVGRQPRRYHGPNLDQLYALCDDGTLWLLAEDRETLEPTWSQMIEIPSDEPEGVSR